MTQPRVARRERVPARVAALAPVLSEPLDFFKDSIVTALLLRLADSLPAADSFIVVWPQAYEHQWGMCGADLARRASVPIWRPNE